MFDQTHAPSLAPSVDPHSFSQLSGSSRKALALDLMMRLAKDDDFREMMIREPVAATSQYGINLDPGKLPKEGIKLPSKERIAQHLDVIATRFSASPDVILIFII